MVFSGVPNQMLVYGTLFSLSNRIQTHGDGFFPDITSKQHFVLMAIDLFADRSPNLKEVSNIIGCSYQNIKKIAVSLEKKGYLKIEQDIYDKRKYNLVKTAKVQEVSTRIDTSIKEFMSVLYRGVSEEKIACVLETLSLMNKNLEEYTGEV